MNVKDSGEQPRDTPAALSPVLCHLFTAVNSLSSQTVACCFFYLSCYWKLLPLTASLESGPSSFEALHSNCLLLLLIVSCADRSQRQSQGRGQSQGWTQSWRLK